MSVEDWPVLVAPCRVGVELGSVDAPVEPGGPNDGGDRPYVS